MILEWLTDCSLPYSTTAGWEAKSKNPEGLSPWGWKSQLVFSRRWNHRQVINNTREVLSLAIQERASRQCENFLPLCSYIGLKMKAWPKLKVCVPDSNSGLKASFFCWVWRLRPLIQALWKWIMQVYKVSSKEERVEVVVVIPGCQLDYIWNKLQSRIGRLNYDLNL